MLFNAATFKNLPEPAVFGLSGLVLFGVAYGVSKINGGLGLTLAAVFAGIFIFEGGAIAAPKKGK